MATSAPDINTVRTIVNAWGNMWLVESPSVKTSEGGSVPVRASRTNVRFQDLVDKTVAAHRRRDGSKEPVK